MWYYVGNGQPQGPLDDDALDVAIGQGLVTPDTSVWKEGQADWAPLRQVRPHGLPQAATAGPESTCSMCNRLVGEDNLIELMGVRVCAACKPLALQSLREGAPLTGVAGVWADGNRVVARDDAAFPQRCFKCNAPSGQPAFRQRVQWLPPAYYAFIAFGLLGKLLVSLAGSDASPRKAWVSPHLCERHASRRKNYRIGGIVALLLGFGIIVYCLVSASSPDPVRLQVAVFVGFPLFVGALVVFFSIRIVGVTMIKDGTVWLRGAGKEFLASLPTWTSGK